jgi:hypothetical protein
MTNQPGLLHLLNDASSPYRDPLTRLNWDSVDLDLWWLPPHAVSLAGVEEFETLPIAARRRLSHFEFVHLLETGLWLESVFTRHLARAFDGSEPAVRSRYLHEIREKSGHSLMFLELMDRSGIHIPEAAAHRPRLFKVISDHVDMDSALFWAMALICEELADKLNRTIRQPADNAPVSAVVHHVATLRIMDEARHIALARASFSEASQRLNRLQRAAKSLLVSVFLRSYTRHLFFPPAIVYQSAGLDGARAWCKRALANPARRHLVERAVKPTLDFLRDQGWTIRSVHA